MSRKKYILVDAANMFARAKHVVHRGDIDMRIGMALHIMFNSLRKSWRDLGGDHVVYCTEGKSWRKGEYVEYKANRVLAQLKKTPREREDDELFFEALDDLKKFVSEKTNCTMLHCPVAEADDLIAMWIDLHPDDDHIIVSSDSDFVQMIAPNVELYNGVTETLFRHDGVFDSKGNRCEFSIKSDGKIKVGNPDPFFEPDREDWTQFAMFLKCIRGDKSDNIFPAYPGARIKGSKNKTGITEAWEDRNTQSYDWNNFMLQTWTDVDGKVQSVKEAYETNLDLIDLRRQPNDVKEMLVTSIVLEVDTPRKQNVGVYFMKFCSKWDLRKIADYPDEYARMFNSHYEGHLLKVAEEIE